MVHRSICVGVALLLSIPLVAVTSSPAVADATPARISAIGSDTLLADSTSSAIGSDQAVEVVADSSAKTVEAWLDGVRVSTRSMASIGAETYGRVALSTPTVGRHVLLIKVISDGGATSTSEYRFSISPAGKRTGLVLGPSGAPVEGALVELHAADGQAWGKALAVVKSDAHGVWGVPQLDLPEGVIKAARRNGGVVNVEAVVSGGVSRGGSAVPVFGLSQFSLKIDAKGVVVPPSGGEAIPDLRARDVQKPYEVQAPKVGRSIGSSGAIEQLVNDGRSKGFTDSSGRLVGGPDPTSALSASASPFIESHAITVGAGAGPVSTAGEIVSPAAAGDLDGCTYSGQGVKILKATYFKYSSVIEGHSGDNSYATVKYGTTSGTTFSAGISYDFGSTWTVSGTGYVGNSTGTTLGYSGKGPHYARELDIPIKYQEYDYWACGLRNGVYQKVTYQGTGISAKGYAVPNGGALSKLGADVSSMDDYYHWKGAPYRYKMAPGTTFDITTSKFKKYTTSASASGFTFTAETSLSSSRSQSIKAGSSKIVTHYIFGYQNVAEGMKIFYAY